MSCKIIALPEFARKLKRLSKKYRNIKQDFRTLSETLRQNPKAGVHLWGGCYKMRVANSSIPTGKSGGFRVIYYFLDERENLYLLSIYSKTEQSTISDEVIHDILVDNGLIES